MTDPVSRAAKRQNLLDAIADDLAGWGCPSDVAPARAQHLLLVAEQHGWSLPTTSAPPLSGRGSTDEGRARARRAFAQTRAGCTCGPDVLGRDPLEHLEPCPVLAVLVGGAS
jgi:hypothetical protein